MECLGYLKYCSLSRLTLTTSQDSQYTSETISASILPTLQWFISKHGPEIFINHFSINHSQSTQQAVTEVIFLLLYSKNSLLFSFAESRSIAYLLKNYSSFFYFAESGLKLENNSSIHAGQWDEADKIPELTYNIPMQIHYTNWNFNILAMNVSVPQVFRKLALWWCLANVISRVKTFVNTL